MRGLVALLPLLLGISGSVLKTPGDLGCDEGWLTMAISPDMRWRATLAYVVCGGPMASEFWNQVLLVNLDALHDEGAEVVALEGDAEIQHKLSFDWESSTLLRITLPNTAVVMTHLGQWRGVQIELRFDPDDPAARESYLRERERRRSIPYEIPDRRAR
jgi:hypothetical protein